MSGGNNEMGNVGGRATTGIAADNVNGLAGVSQLSRLQCGEGP